MEFALRQQPETLRLRSDVPIRFSEVEPRVNTPVEVLTGFHGWVMAVGAPLLALLSNWWEVDAVGIVYSRGLVWTQLNHVRKPAVLLAAIDSCLSVARELKRREAR